MFLVHGLTLDGSFGACGSEINRKLDSQQLVVGRERLQRIGEDLVAGAGASSHLRRRAGLPGPQVLHCPSRPGTNRHNQAGMNNRPIGTNRAP